jgi:hypothetical protein
LNPHDSNRQTVNGQADDSEITNETKMTKPIEVLENWIAAFKQNARTINKGAVTPRSHVGCNPCGQQNLEDKQDELLRLF